MSQTTTGQVRQILMNELGLTRESVRAETEKIVVNTVHAHVTNMASDGRLERWILKTIDAESRSHGFSRGGLRGIVQEAAAHYVQKWLEENMAFPAHPEGREPGPYATKCRMKE